MNNLARNGYAIGRSGRLLLGAWSLILLFGFGVAFCLEPSPNGYGTHQQLGLPPCTFRMLFGISCPSCGMTTSLSHFVRGQFLQSIDANAAGFLLAVVCALQIPWSWWSIYRGCFWSVWQPAQAFVWLLAIFCAATLINWAIRLLTI
jgi:hypothetical protein